MQAIRHGRHDIAKVLLEHHASVDATRDSTTALMYAVQSRSLEGVEVLLSHRASVNMTNELGATSLMTAVQDSQCPDDVVRALLGAGSSCNLRVNGRSVKECACLSHGRVIEQHEQKTLILTLHVRVIDPNV